MKNDKTNINTLSVTLESMMFLKATHNIHIIRV